MKQLSTCSAGSACAPVKCLCTSKVLCTSKATEHLQCGLRIRVTRTVVFNSQSDLASIRYMKNETDENRRENIKWLRLEAALHCADNAEVCQRMLPFAGVC